MRGLAALLVLLCVTPVSAQEWEIDRADLPRDVADRLIGVFYDPATTRFDGDARVPADRVIQANVAVFGGNIVIEGRIEGDLVVVHGNAQFEPGAVVTGDITVVGGTLRYPEDGRVGGTLTAYEEGFRYVKRGERGRYMHRHGRFRPHLGGEVHFGDARLTLRAGGYNRVEGLPLQFGPSVATSGGNPARLEAFAVFRTSEAPFALDQVGYTARIEQFLFGKRSVRLGAAVYSIIDPIERWGLPETESALAALLFHNDTRDYFEREGWKGYLRLTPHSLPLDLTVEFRDEAHGLAPAADPWTVFGSDPWRLSPLVATGDYRAVAGRLEIDMRDDAQDPLDGWYLAVSAEKGVDTSLQFPDFATTPGLPDEPAPGALASFDPEAVHALIDLRTHEEVSRGSRLNLRGVVGGAIEDRALAPQFQHALGGIGSMPGHPTLSIDCGARSDEVYVSHRNEQFPFVPFYGCDRFALFQAELRGHLDFHLTFGLGDDAWEDDDWEWEGDLYPSWSVFFDAGRGWVAGDVAGPSTIRRRDTDWQYDVGVGFLLSEFGLYWAVPINGDRDLNFFVRINKRF